jgi:SAM-dependent methyltransferase
MDTIFFDAKTDPTLKWFINRQLEDSGELNCIISPKDEIHLFDLQHFSGDQNQACYQYFHAGKLAMEEIEQIILWGFGGFENITSFLDFGAGHGRFTRFLIQKLPPFRIWAADISADAIKFQQNHFCVNGIISTSSPLDYHDQNKYDCILAASVFSHLPENLFKAWLQKLYGLLTDNGLLLFSVHGMELLPSLPSDCTTGFVFFPYSESQALDKELYGTTYVEKSYVKAAIEEIVSHRNHHLIHKGLWGFQDLYLVSKKPERDFSTLNFSLGLLGGVNEIENESDKVCFRGWAVDFDNPAGKTKIQILVDDRVVETCRPIYARPDVAQYFLNENSLVSGWRGCFPKKYLLSANRVAVEAANAKGYRRILFIKEKAALIDEAQKNTVVQYYQWFRPEGIGFYAYLDQKSGTVPVYRFLNTTTGGHFYTIDEGEKNAIIQNYQWFLPEGIGFYAYPVQQPGTLPVYRFFNPIGGKHFFTVNEEEKNFVLQNYNWFRFEGTGFFAYPSP